MRYLLDTNVLVFYILGQEDEISSEVQDILKDYNNTLYTSSIAIMELIQLYRLKKIRSKNYKNRLELVKAITDEYFIEIRPFSKEHATTLSVLKIAEGHNDPFDHAIISHAITEKLALISSDGKFDKYRTQKLDFVHNIR